MLAFVSMVTNINDPVQYDNLQGASYSAIQTNESAIVYVQRKLEKESHSKLAKIFLIVSDTVYKTILDRNKNAVETEFGVTTHLDFLKQRLIKEYPDLKDKFSEQNYSDGDEALEKNILQIGEIANAINEYAKDKEIIVHADMTGGFRHASMLMLLIIQLLKYRHIKSDDILYSAIVNNTPGNRRGVVYSVDEIQKVSTLITGADEFVKFGSVEALQEYFERNQNETTKELLDAMKRFSEAIKICHTSAIKNELKNLGEHIKKFRETANKDVQSELFAKIIDTVESEYGNLIEGNTNNIDIIRWCINKGFLQQAMTLCTEWLPLEIVSRKIYVPKDDTIIKDAKKEGESFGRGWQQQFVISYNRKEKKSENKASSDSYCRRLRCFIKNYPNLTDEDLDLEIPNNVKKILAEYSQGRKYFKPLKNDDLSPAFKKNCPHLFEVLRALCKARPNNPRWFVFLKNLNYETILSQICTLKSETLIDILKIPKNAINLTRKKSEDVSKEKLEEASKEKWDNRQAIYLKMLNNDFAVSNQEIELTLQLLKGYYEIRNERNMLNHANEDEEKDVKRRDIPNLKDMMLNYLAEIEKINVE